MDNDSTLISKKAYSCKAVLKHYLEKEISNIPNAEDYNLFVHKVYNFDENQRSSEGITCKSNLEGIFKFGLNKFYYSSLLKTATYKNELNATIDKIESIVGYNYSGATPEQYVVMLAIPKTIEINNEKVNFTTPIFSLNRYKSLNNLDYCQYTMPYDLCTRYSNIKNHFILGAIKTNPPSKTVLEYKQGKDEGLFELYLNDNHISKVSKENQQEIMKSYSDTLIKKCGINSYDSKDRIEEKIASTMKRDDKDYLESTSKYDEI